MTQTIENIIDSCNTEIANIEIKPAKSDEYGLKHRKALKCGLKDSGASLFFNDKGKLNISFNGKKYKLNEINLSMGGKLKLSE
jgi:hypothetical protein